MNANDNKYINKIGNFNNDITNPPQAAYNIIVT